MSIHEEIVSEKKIKMPPNNCLVIILNLQDMKIRECSVYFQGLFFKWISKNTKKWVLRDAWVAQLV